MGSCLLARQLDGMEDRRLVGHRGKAAKVPRPSMQRRHGLAGQRTLNTPFIPAAACPGTVHR
jgi:hypothetical protein